MFEGRSVFKAVSRSVVQTRPSIRGAKGKKHRLTSAKHESEECYESVQDWNSIKYLAGDWTNNLSVTIHQELTFKLVVSTGSVVFVRVRRCAMHSGSAALHFERHCPLIICIKLRSRLLNAVRGVQSVLSPLEAPGKTIKTKHCWVKMTTDSATARQISSDEWVSKWAAMLAGFETPEQTSSGQSGGVCMVVSARGCKARGSGASPHVPS